MPMPVTRALPRRPDEVRDLDRFRLALAGALLCIFALDAKASAPSLTDVLTASGVDLHGYLDTAYSYLSGTGMFASGVADRVFDTEPNSFNLHQAALTIDYQPRKVSAVSSTSRRDETPA